ncbi:MAG: ABC transporter permease [Prevotellaceae bacterium]|jgi:ABC-2 type transport system permease protein|nr:ABC transporter permease [Prevotellaceae bacterium]
MNIKKNIKEDIRDSFIIWRNEFQSVFSDAGVIIFFIVAPLFYPLLYGLIYDNETVKEVPMVVVDNDNSAKSREFIRLCDATRDVRIAGKCADMEEAKRLLKEKKAYGIMLIPRDFNKKMVRAEKAYVSLFADMSSLLYYKAFLLTLTEVSLSMGEEIQIENISGATARQEEIAVAPMTYENIAFFNPKSGFASFLIPAVLILVIQQTLLLGISILSGAARDRNTYRNLQPMQRRRQGTLHIVFGKTLCYMMIYSLMTVYLLGIVPRIFGLPREGDELAIFLFMLPYLLACIFFSMTLTVFVRDRESPFILFVFTSVLFLFISGISWPASAIPWYWKEISCFIPSTFGIQGFIKLNTMGATLRDVSFEYLMLWGQACVYFITACLVIRRKILQSGKIKMVLSQKSF